ncbi:MAG: hypothetical protein UX62_C0017G0005 [Microgenomates group bacterium GW2011_GWA2_46_7]|nr:MAG: hypothetical protein UX62_C0017G0005 [Microgenomates group bacterium GW2011_GWA2_46_7]
MDNFWDDFFDDFTVTLGKVKSGLSGFLGTAGGKDDEIGTR